MRTFEDYGLRKLEEVRGGLPESIPYKGMVIQPHPKGFFVFSRDDTTIDRSRPFPTIEEAARYINTLRPQGHYL